MRVFIFLFSAYLLCLNCLAQDQWPSKPVRIVDPYAAGGVGDAVFHVIAPLLEQKFGTRFII